ncbi:MAG: hypothetical protein PHG23_03735 [Candidatus Pacebacteria bacterium]|nr:hypothetical protein [Candidatus Paceibacterota bacterium]
MKKVASLLIVLCLCCLAGAVSAATNPGITVKNASLENQAVNVSGLITPDCYECINCPGVYINVIDPLIQRQYGPDFYRKIKIRPGPYIKKTVKEERDLFVKSWNKKKWRIDWDKERAPLKYIGIHAVNNTTIGEMNAYYKANLYAPRYQSAARDPYVKGLKPHSGHLIGTEESFLPFHWVIYPDGTVVSGLNTALVQTSEGLAPYSVAWSLGNWEANCESYSMAFVFDENQQYPTWRQIWTANCIIHKVKELVPSVTLAPHYQFNSQTNCPGDKYQYWSKLLF